jgi:hypothetical protein
VLASRNRFERDFRNRGNRSHSKGLGRSLGEYAFALSSSNPDRRWPQLPLRVGPFMPSKALVTRQRRASSYTARVHPAAAAAMIRNLAKTLTFQRMTMKPIARMTV